MLLRAASGDLSARGIQRRRSHPIPPHGSGMCSTSNASSYLCESVANVCLIIVIFRSWRCRAVPAGVPDAPCDGRPGGPRAGGVRCPTVVLPLTVEVLRCCSTLTPNFKNCLNVRRFGADLIYMVIVLIPRGKIVHSPPTVGREMSTNGARPNPNPG